MQSETCVPDDPRLVLLFAEDDETDYKLVLRQFARQKRAIEPRRCITCGEAIDAFRGGTFDALVVDLNLPGGSGVDLIRFVRSIDANLPIIVLTGNGSEAAAVEAIKQGANDYLVKERETFAQLPAQISCLVQAYRAETERRKPQGEIQLLQDRLRDFAEAASDWFWEKGPDLKFTFVSDSVEDCLGIPPSAFLGKSIWDFLTTTPELEKTRHEYEVHKRENFRDFVCDIPTPSAGTRTVRISGKAVFNADGSFAGYRGIGSDITQDIKNAESLRQAKDEAVEASLAKSRFLAVMSHEFRTPLNAILGFTDAMLGGVAGQLSDKQQEYLNDVRLAGQHMLSLVSDVLDLSRIEAGQYDLDLMDLELKPELCAAVKFIEFGAEERDLTVTVELDDPTLRLTADRRALAQILTNIMSNAVKFTAPGGRIEVSARETDGSLEICIQDTGIGIPQDKLHDVTLPFHQIDNVLSRKHDGSGLGLSIASGLLAAHGGHMNIDSTPDVGTKVCLYFPRGFPERA